ncbi:MAG: rhodanese-like domain-containing protein [Anaerolineae bacterium]|nr:rhodanese-like domain-containing protein [Anaerolineae bacterium]
MGILDWFLGRGAPRITPQEAHTLLTEDGDTYLLLDVRQPSEYSAGVAQGAVQIPLTQLGSRLDELPRERQILTICASGHRSPLAARRLARAGFQVKDVQGGTQAWRAAGLALEKES